MTEIRVDLEGEEEVHMLYTLSLIGPPTVHEYGYIAGQLDRALLRETEENMTDLLPPGYRVEIREWDSHE